MWGIDEKCLKCSHEPSPPFTLREQVKQGTLKRYKRHNTVKRNSRSKGHRIKIKPHIWDFLTMSAFSFFILYLTVSSKPQRSVLQSKLGWPPGFAHALHQRKEEREKRSACVYTHQSAPVIPVKALQLLSVWVSPYRNVLYKVKHHPLVRGENSSLGCHSTDKRANTSLNM